MAAFHWPEAADGRFKFQVYSQGRGCTDLFRARLQNCMYTWSESHESRVFQLPTL